MTYHVAKITPSADPNVLFARPGGLEPLPHTVTTTYIGNSLSYSPLGMGRLVAPLYRNTLDWLAVDAPSRTITVPIGALSLGDTHASGWLDGAELWAMRHVNGKLIQAGTTRVQQTIVKIVASVHSWTQALAAGASEFRWSPPGFHKPGATHYFAVAAIDANGKRGPWSNVVKFTFGDTTSPVTDNTAGLVAAPAFDPAQVPLATLGAPSGLTAMAANSGKTVALSFTPVPGLRHIVARSWHPDFVSDERVVVADPSFIQPGDALVVSHRIDHSFPKSQMLSPRVWSASAANSFGLPGIAPFNEDLPAGVSYQFLSENGRDFVRVQVQAGATFSARVVTHSGTAQSFYRVLDPAKSYFVRLVARAAAAGNVVLGMQDSITPTVARSISTAWSSVEGVFQPTGLNTLGSARTATVAITGPMTLDIQYMLTGEAGIEPFAATPFEEESLIASGASHVRMHASVKTRPWSYSMKDFLSDYGFRPMMGNSLPQSLKILLAARARSAAERAARAAAGMPRDNDGGPLGLCPWIQVEPWMTDAELAMLGGYLCTPYSDALPAGPVKEGAALRVAQGRTAPWQDAFENIRFEVGNEMYQAETLPDFYKAVPIGDRDAPQVNGLLLDRFAEALMAVGGFDAGKWSFYLGGRGGEDPATLTGWSGKGALASRHADLIGSADYNGGWDNGLTSAQQAGDPVALFRVLANTNTGVGSRAPRTIQARRWLDLCAAVSSGRGKPIRPMHYEAGPNYVINGLAGGTLTASEGVLQEELMKSVAAGTATLDAWLFNAAHGISTNYFNMNFGDKWACRAEPHNGGAYNPAFMWSAFVNERLRGPVRVADTHRAEPLVGPDALQYGDSVRAYTVSRADGACAYVLVNIDPANTRTVKVRCLARAGRSWTRHFMTGSLTDYNHTLASKDTVRIEAEAMPAGFGEAGFTVTIPPGKAEVYIEAAA